MGWLSAIGSFFGGKGGGKVMDFADKAVYTSQEKSQDDIEEMKGVRLMQFEGLLGTLVPLYQSAQSTFARGIILLMIFIDVLVELSARVIRPWVTIEIVGYMFNYWSFDIPVMTPYQEMLVTIVLTFWFGGRALMKDFPKMLSAFRKIRVK